MIPQMMAVGNQVRNYYELTKPKIWYLLVFTAFASALTASLLFNVHVPPLTWILIIGGVAAGSAAADTLTSYNDRDIDAIMERTKARPIPSGRISPKNALMFGLILAVISLVFAWLINIWAFALMIFGLFDNIIVYSKWLKRRSQTNIILGGFSGGAPALIGYVAVTTQNIEIGLVMAGLVFLWIPTHIWSLALHVKKDYTKARVPMLPVISGEKRSVRIIAGTTLMMVVFSILPFFFGQFGLIYLITASIFGVVMVLLSIWLLIKPSEKASWTVFKFSSPYLTALFIGFMVDALFH
ncbi:MAG: heme o synthase [Nitrososphaeraceae archaeon]|jgi:heme o synthase|nr:heme o synthase [Nitrososphaeraceae archaeon]MDW0256727.1 heme o synthase [Nitrososphaeraceae archaeon]MDW0281267.1 heme o synthase [Nitrososphaeraceae archaeon]MDW0331711.1 heme o synthase [Nitrososphaeraceae archaeon]